MSKPKQSEAKSADTPAPAAKLVADVEPAPYGEGSRAANEDGSEPKGFPMIMDSVTPIVTDN